MFLTLNDYKPIIKTDMLNRATENDDSNRTVAEKNAEALIRTYLRGRYDVDAIFAATGDNRNFLIVRYMIDITLYELYSRISPDQVNDVRLKRYDEAMAWLKEVRDGVLSPDLPDPVEPDPDPEDTDSTNTFVTSNHEKQNFDY